MASHTSETAQDDGDDHETKSDCSPLEVARETNLEDLNTDTIINTLTILVLESLSSVDEDSNRLNRISQVIYNCLVDQDWAKVPRLKMSTISKAVTYVLNHSPSDEGGQLELLVVALTILVMDYTKAPHDADVKKVSQEFLEKNPRLDCLAIRYLIGYYNVKAQIVADMVMDDKRWSMIENGIKVGVTIAGQNCDLDANLKCIRDEPLILWNRLVPRMLVYRVIDMPGPVACPEEWRELVDLEMVWYCSMDPVTVTCTYKEAKVDLPAISCSPRKIQPVPVGSLYSRPLGDLLNVNFQDVMYGRYSVVINEFPRLSRAEYIGSDGKCLDMKKRRARKPESPRSRKSSDSDHKERSTARPRERSPDEDGPSDFTTRW